MVLQSINYVDGMTGRQHKLKQQTEDTTKYDKLFLSTQQNNVQLKQSLNCISSTWATNHSWFICILFPAFHHFAPLLMQLLKIRHRPSTYLPRRPCTRQESKSTNSLRQLDNVINCSNILINWLGAMLMKVSVTKYTSYSKSSWSLELVTAQCHRLRVRGRQRWASSWTSRSAWPCGRTSCGHPSTAVACQEFATGGV